MFISAKDKVAKLKRICLLGALRTKNGAPSQIITPSFLAFQLSHLHLIYLANLATKIIPLVVLNNLYP